MKLSTTMMINETLLPTNKKAFTLAEVLITLSILGVVAAMTIPTLVNRQSDIAAQTRLKKAISNYHDLVEVYLIDSGESDAKNMFTTVGGVNCSNAGEFFKMTNQDNCKITAADGAYWEIDKDTGNAWVYDAASSPRYGVFMWNANGFVNSDQCNESGSCGTGTTYVDPGLTPVNGYYNAKEFLASTGAELKAKNGTTSLRKTASEAVKKDPTGDGSGKTKSGANNAGGTGLGQAIPKKS